MNPFPLVPFNCSQLTQNYGEFSFRLSKPRVARFPLGLAYYRKEKINKAKYYFEEAKEMFKTAFLKNPDNIEALKNLGVIFWKEENWKEVISIYRKLSRLLPKEQEFKYWFKRAKENCN